MILEEETFREFGYISSELKPKSNKKILAACDDCGKVRAIMKRAYYSLCASCCKKGHIARNKGGHLSEETKRKMRENQPDRSGEKNSFFGRHHTEETKEKLSEASKGENNHNYGKHLSEETRKKIREANTGHHPSEESRDKMREARKHQIPKTHHTKPEMAFEGFCTKDTLPFRYTGDSAFWIGKGKDVINPDFVHLTKKIVVEIFSWHHDQLQNHHVRPKGRYEDRKKIYKKYGYKMIVFWQEDLEREDAEEYVLHVLRKNKII